MHELDEGRGRVFRDWRRLAGGEVGNEHRDALRAAQRIEQVEFVGLFRPLERGQAAHAVHDRRRLFVEHPYAASRRDVQHVRVVPNEDRIARRGVRIRHEARLRLGGGIERIAAHAAFVHADHRDLLRVGRPDQLRTPSRGPVRRQCARGFGAVCVLVDAVGGQLDRAVRKRQRVDARGPPGALRGVGGWLMVVNAGVAHVDVVVVAERLPLLVRREHRPVRRIGLHDLGRVGHGARIRRDRALELPLAHVELERAFVVAEAEVGDLHRIEDRVAGERHHLRQVDVVEQRRLGPLHGIDEIHDGLAPGRRRAIVEARAVLKPDRIHRRVEDERPGRADEVGLGVVRVCRRLRRGSLRGEHERDGDQGGG